MSSFSMSWISGDRQCLGSISDQLLMEDQLER